MMWGYHYGYGMDNGWIGLILGLLFLVLIIAGAIWALRYLPKSLESRNSALDILKERYARGEISQAQFEEMKKDLEA